MVGTKSPSAKAPAKAAPVKKKAPAKKKAPVVFRPNVKKATAFIAKNMGLKPKKMYLGQLPHSPSGSFMVDDLIGGTLAYDGKAPVCPGYPRKKLTEIYGEEASGKTTAAITAVVEAQKRGEVAMFIDHEHALHHGYAKAMGLNFSQEHLMLYEPDTMEEGLKLIFLGIKIGVGIIVVDSVAAMVPAREMKKDVKDEAKIGAVPKKMSETLPKMMGWLSKPPKGSPGTTLIFLNQTRATIDTSGGKPTKGAPKNTSGGKAIKFYAYLRLFFKRIGGESIKRKDKLTGKDRYFPYGNHTEVTIIKNKADGKEGHRQDIFIRFGKGIDDILSIVVGGIENKLIKKEGAWLTYKGARIQGKEKFREYLLQNPKVAAELRAQILEAIRGMASDADPKEDDEYTEYQAEMEGMFGEAPDKDDEDDEDAEDTVLSEEESEGVEEVEVEEIREEVSEIGDDL